MKKLTSIFLIIIMLVLVTSCNLENEGKTLTNTNSDINQEQTSENLIETTAASTIVTVTEKVIFDQDGIKITLKSFDAKGSYLGPGLSVLVENNSDKNITVQTRDSSVNGVMVNTIFSCDVAAGKKANDTIVFSDDDLKSADIEIIKDIEFKLHIFDSESWNVVADSDVIVVATSADASYIQTYDSTGFVAFNQGGYKIVIKKLDDNYSFWGADLMVYIENNTDGDVTIQVRDVSINGFMVDPVFSCDITGGKKAFSSITFLESDLEDNGITDITEIELSFHIYNTDSYDTIIDSEPVAISF